MWLLYLILNVIYVLAGVAALIVFLWMQFYAAGVFGFITALISGVTAHLIWLNRKQTIELWYEQHDLNQLFWLGFWTFALSTSGLVYYLTAMIILQEWPMVHVVAAIWASITLKSGTFLMHLSYRYWKQRQLSPERLHVNDQPA